MNNTPSLVFKIAEPEEIEQVLALHYKYQVDSIAEEDKADGFVTTAFTAEQLAALIKQESGLFIAKRNEEVVAYVMAASWEYWSVWPMFAFMIKELPKLSYKGIQLNTQNSYQYGPVCIDKSERGTGLLAQLFDFSLAEMAKRFSVLVTFVNKINPRSYQAHGRKLGLDTIQEFEFNGNQYYEMACLTKEP